MPSLDQQTAAQMAALEERVAALERGVEEQFGGDIKAQLDAMMTQAKTSVDAYVAGIESRLEAAVKAALAKAAGGQG